MGLLQSIDVRPKAAPVLPEGQYTLICTNAMWTRTLKKDAPQSEYDRLKIKSFEDDSNVKGLLLSFQFKAMGQTGECTENFNLFNDNQQARQIAVENLGAMAQAMGFNILPDGSIDGVDDDLKCFKGKKVAANVVIRPNWKNESINENQVKSWIIPTANQQQPQSAPPPVNQSAPPVQQSAPPAIDYSDMPPSLPDEAYSNDTPF